MATYTANFGTDGIYQRLLNILVALRNYGEKKILSNRIIDEITKTILGRYESQKIIKNKANYYKFAKFISAVCLGRRIYRIEKKIFRPEISFVQI
jgi:hypothetical protein